MAAKWYWKDDSDWKEYEKKLAKKLEKSFRAKEKECKVDDSRFVDVENMLQRRYDDKMKRRAVKREVVECFKKEIFYLMGKFSRKEDEIKDDIELSGGIVSSTLTKKVTHIVTVKKNVGDFPTEMENADKWSIPVVTEEFIADSIDECKKLDEKDYIVKKKRKKDEKEDEEDEGKGKKKAKTDDAPTSSDTATTSTSTSSAPAINTDKVDDSMLVANTKWMGVATQKDDHFLFGIDIISRVDNKIQAIMSWPTLDNGQTKARGEITGKQFVLDEYEIIKGNDCVVPNKYTGIIAPEGNKVAGKFKDSTGENGTFKIEYVKVSLKEKIHLNSEYAGICYQPFPFRLQISKVDGSAIEGFVTWPTANNAKTKIRGTITNEELTFEEYELVVGADVDVPTNYHGKIFVNTLKGEFKAKEMQGDFKIELAKPVEPTSDKMDVTK